MLLRLSIQNYALIDQLELEFKEGLNIITGETGAGKSILLGALSLILGQRADSTSLLDPTRKSIVEGEFKFSKKQAGIIGFFKELDLDLEKTILLRRELSAEGKSRAFINDTPVNLQQMRELGGMLIDIHSQHETLLLNRSDFQLSSLDAFAGISDGVEKYKKSYQNYVQKLNALEKLIEDENKVKADQDYFQFQFTELSEAALQEGEQELLEDELKTLSNADEIRNGINSLEQLLSTGENNVIELLHRAGFQMHQLGNYNAKLEALSERLKSSEIELKDIITELEDLSSEIAVDPSRLEIVTDRLNIIYKLQQKHRKNSIAELIELREEFDNKLSGIQTLEAQIELQKRECLILKSQLYTTASQLSSRRTKTIPDLELNIKKLLKEVGMANAVLKIENDCLPEGEIGPNGIDAIRYLFSANKGVAYSDISKVASGGELSRLMLCLKSAVAKLIELPSLIFDEIDTGVSGETAFKIGKLMHEMSFSHQLIVITHLPQIAGRGNTHFFVYKEVSGKKTYTKVRALSKEDRVIEIARMLSGDKPTSIAMQNAKELMKA
ncbi:MAG TPA: DNA repair protein RecN [Bacteroidia bacterium]|nr:DNA repair protein RecN [Bacteroidia bacterium]HNS11187.1 DNA repair protein RecN [Bacteroidia bacterium]